MNLQELRRLATESLELLASANKGPYDDARMIAIGKAKQLFAKHANEQAVISIIDRLDAAEKVCFSLFSDFCEWQVDVDALKFWQEKYEKQYLTEYEEKQKEVQ